MKTMHTSKRTMKSNIRHSFLLGVALGALLALNSSAQDTQPSTAAPLTAERAILVTVTAKVEAIDQAKREVTLKGPMGNVVTFVVDERVKRLKEVKVGDEVTADYYVSVASELRAPTDAEKKTPLTILAGAARAPKGTSPAGGAVRAFKVVATVIGLDLPTQSVTLQGPLGNSGTIRAESVENLKQLRLGDTVVVTYTEALAISLQKAQSAKPKERIEPDFNRSKQR
jgi:hypothetical protein